MFVFYYCAKKVMGSFGMKVQSWKIALWKYQCKDWLHQDYKVILKSLLYQFWIIISDWLVNMTMYITEKESICIPIFWSPSPWSRDEILHEVFDKPSSILFKYFRQLQLKDQPFILLYCIVSMLLFWLFFFDSLSHSKSTQSLFHKMSISPIFYSFPLLMAL